MIGNYLHNTQWILLFFLWEISKWWNTPICMWSINIVIYALFGSSFICSVEFVCEINIYKWALIDYIWQMPSALCWSVNYSRHWLTVQLLHVFVLQELMAPFVTYHRFLSFSFYMGGVVGFVLSLVKKHYLKQFTLVSGLTKHFMHTGQQWSVTSLRTTVHANQACNWVCHARLNSLVNIWVQFLLDLIVSLDCRAHHMYFICKCKENSPIYYIFMSLIYYWSFYADICIYIFMYLGAVNTDHRHVSIAVSIPLINNHAMNSLAISGRNCSR